MNNLLSRFFNMMGKQNVYKMFWKKRTNNRMIWASIISVIVSAAAYFLRKNQGIGNQANNSVQNVMNSLMTAQTTKTIPNAVMAEFAKELLPGNTNQTNQTNQTARGTNHVNK